MNEPCKHEPPTTIEILASQKPTPSSCALSPNILEICGIIRDIVREELKKLILSTLQDSRCYLNHYGRRLSVPLRLRLRRALRQAVEEPGGSYNDGYGVPPNESRDRYGGQPVRDDACNGPGGADSSSQLARPDQGSVLMIENPLAVEGATGQETNKQFFFIKMQHGYSKEAFHDHLQVPFELPDGTLSFKQPQPPLRQFVGGL
ncbi:hypothetical protein HPB47_007257 [Ixodes persulcatus]|uniref:Uncharacterized protein n=1 Tax=Ixodes persulcatus TaxID=34615 RepID=A0AC60P7T5_IXOPE|nr:hypothetical protein HPB47_007257 [Ixodes persulcatus]